MQEESLPKLEERILRFWEDRGIFERILKTRLPAGKAGKKGKTFRFFEGPPTANAGPGVHHVLSRIFKDIICRYKTMQGFYVERKAGWDTHGLPVELQIEKELGIKHKSEIEKFGIAEFNKKAKESVWRYKEEWEKFTERIGFWLDLKNPYITYDASYMESLWWVIQRFWKRGLLEEDYKVVPYCPRCETPLSSHEVAQGYETVKDPSIYVKLRIKTTAFAKAAAGKQKAKTPEYLLVWTTTPWTLPANVAVAVHPSVTYTKYEIGGEYYWSAIPPPFDHGVEAEAVEKRAGKSLVGLRYEPIFRTKINDRKIDERGGKIYSVVEGDFVSIEEGTGLVHIAPAFGEEDMETARRWELPVMLNVSGEGRFAFSPAELAAEPFFKKIQNRFVKDADKTIFEELQKRGALYRGDLKAVEHEYPFCWRCGTPLLYYAHKSWFVRMSRLRKELLAANAEINWVPAHIKEGRFGEWLREVKDWAFSRERYWGTPLPIWECTKCGKKEAVGSLAELNAKAYNPNTFFIMRHAQGDHNVKDYIAAWPEPKTRTARLTPKGRSDTERAAKVLAKKRIDLIVSSDLARMKETAATLRKHMPGVKVVYDPRLRELNCGIFNYRSTKEHRRFFKKPIEKFTKRPPGGENLADAQARYFAVWKELNRRHRGKRILILGHGDPLWVFEGRIRGLTPEQILEFSYIKTGEWRELPSNDMPYNDEGEIDLHRPYVDELYIACAKCGSAMKRIPDVADVWFDSGAMPFAEWHYPFDPGSRASQSSAHYGAGNKNLPPPKNFPADYIAEAVDQTRGWFYTLLAVSTALGFKTPPYLNVISLGHILDEKGEKMSKSKGNIVDPWDMIAKYGADSLRWYFYTVNPPGEPKRFAERDLAQKHNGMMLVLNVLNFFKTYAPRKIRLTPYGSNLSVLDKWILVKTSELTSGVEAELSEYEVTEAARKIEAFFDDLSRWYVRRSRRRFQKPKNQEELAVASSVLGTVLLELSKLMAPFTPFVAEHMWREVSSRISAAKHPESVHLAAWPKPKKTTGATETLVKMQAVRELASIGLKLRQAADIKVRQPLAEFVIVKAPDSVRLDDELRQVLADEVNVKKISFALRLPEGRNWETEEAGKWKAALNTDITAELKEEGEFRELVRNIQELRQNAALNPKDRVALYIDAPESVKTEFRRGSAALKKEVGAARLTFARTGKFDAEKEYKRGDGAPIWTAIKKL